MFQVPTNNFNIPVPNPQGVLGERDAKNGQIHFLTSAFVTEFRIPGYCSDTAGHHYLHFKAT